MTPRPPARVYLLPAHDAPVVGVLRRGPSRLWNVLRWDNRNDTVVSGSWFKGTLYPHRADISFDGRWMVYNALGANGADCWGGVCELPILKTIAEWDNSGDYGGGGYWRDAETLVVDRWSRDDPSQAIPFVLDARLPFRGLKEPNRAEIGWKRRARDGWRQIGHDYQKGWTWESQLTPSHPRITIQGYSHPWRFDCPDLPGFLDEAVTDVAWNSRDQLLVARAGWLERYTRKDLEHGEPSFRYDLNPLQPKWA